MSIPNINREPAGTPTGGQFAAGSTSESSASLGSDLDGYERETEPGHYTGKPFMATVQPEAWVNDYAIEAGPAVEFDIAHALHSYDQDSREMLLFDVESGMAADYDYLYEHAAARGDVQEGYGPYTVRMDADRLREWMVDNPPWTQDGKTPHPTGGYVTIEDADSGHESIRSYRDADGHHHREDGPAFIKEDETGVMSRHYKHGKLHNDNGPAQVIHGISGTSKVWYVDGQEAASEVTHRQRGWDIVDGKAHKIND